MASGPHSDMIFKRIETRAVLSDGRVRQSWRSYPLGVGKDVYDRIDADLRRAFGNDGSRTVGTPMDPTLSPVG